MEPPALPPAAADAAPESGWPLPLLFGAAIFWSAALLFWSEPLVAKQLLPRLGGSAAVWNTCLVFFQAVLLAGYAFAHLSAARLPPRAAVWSYLGVLGLAGSALAGGAGGLAIHGEPGSTGPVAWVLLTLLTSIGLPFFALAATGPTLQRWFSLTTHPAADDPYFLFAASNAGSMLALLAFPVLLEPFVATSTQVARWGAGFAALLALALACAVALRRWRAPGPAHARATSPPASATVTARAAAADAVPPAPARAAAPTVWRRVRWIFLAFVPSSLLLGATTYLSTDIAAVPLLWIIPLAIYLATFTLVFTARPPLPHRLMLRLLPLLAAAWVVSVSLRWALPFWAMLLIQLVMLFGAAMACHGELAQDRPPARHLTEFYFWIALGGVLGGAFNALLAPLIFTRTTEYPLAILLALLALPARPRRVGAALSRSLDIAVPVTAWVLAALLFHALEPRSDWWQGVAAGVPALLALAFAGRPLRVALALAAIYVTGMASARGHVRSLYANRDFYGRIRVLALDGGREHELLHGTTLHGKQAMELDLRREPLTYYSRRGPVGQFMATVQDRAHPAGRAARVAVVGLGTGTLTAYARPGESWTYYEIDPAVPRVALDPRLFTYLTDAPARPAIVLGDARLSLRHAPAGAYDLIVLDAFSSDAVPVHLLTREAIRLYLRKLAPHGLVVFNISNRFLDLGPVLAAAARDEGLVAWHRDDDDLSTEDQDRGVDPSDWAVLARDEADLGPLVRTSGWVPIADRELRAWTDDFSGLLPIVKW